LGVPARHPIIVPSCFFSCSRGLYFFLSVVRSFFPHLFFCCFRFEACWTAARHRLLPLSGCRIRLGHWVGQFVFDASVPVSLRADGTFPVQGQLAALAEDDFLLGPRVGVIEIPRIEVFYSLRRFLFSSTATFSSDRSAEFLRCSFAFFPFCVLFAFESGYFPCRN